MSEFEAIIKEKNDLITELKKENLDLKQSHEKDKDYYKNKSANMITKKSVAEEIYLRLKKIKFIAGIAIIAPPIAGIASGFHFMAGAVLGCFAAVAAVMLSKREVFAEIQRLKEKYNLK